MMKRENNKDWRAITNLLWCPPSTNPRANTFPPKRGSIFRVLSSKPAKMEKPRGRRVWGRCLGTLIAIGLTKAGNIRATASANRILTEAVA
jgi:hypothetical protein